MAPAKTREQAANATAVYDMSTNSTPAASNTAPYQSTIPLLRDLPSHATSNPELNNSSYSAKSSAASDSSTAAVPQGVQAGSSAAGSLGNLIQVLALPCHRMFSLTRLLVGIATIHWHRQCSWSCSQCKLDASVCHA